MALEATTHAAMSEIYRAAVLAMESRSEAVKAFGVLLLSRLPHLEKDGPSYADLSDLEVAIEMAKAIPEDSDDACDSEIAESVTNA